MQQLTLPVKLSLLSVFISVTGLVCFIFNPSVLQDFRPWAVWTIGLIIGAGSPAYAFADGHPQSGQYYFGFVCNLAFLLVLTLFVPAELH